MKNTKNLLRAWISAASVVGLFFGWVTFAHSNKAAVLPVVQSLSPTTSATSVTTSSTTTTTTTSIQGFQVIQQPSFSTSPRIRTGGS